MSRSRLFVAVAVAAGALLVVVARRAAVLDRPARGTLAGTVSAGELCNAPSSQACRRWLDAEPVLEFSPADHVGTENHPASVDPDGTFRIGLAPGRYMAWWRLSGLGGSLTNHGSHLWNVAPDATTHVARFTPYVGWANTTRG
jgi:hypothetical protein